MSGSLMELGPPVVVTASEQDDQFQNQTLPQKESIRNDHLLKRIDPKRRASVAVWSDALLSSFASNIEKKLACQTSKLHFKSSDKLFTAPKTICKGAGISGLEHNILANIFRCLDLKSKLKLRRVCKLFEALLMTDEYRIFESMNFEQWKKSTNDSNTFSILQFTGLKVSKLQFTGCWMITNITLGNIAKLNHSVVDLDLHSAWDITDEGLQLIAEKCVFLERIDLSNCRKVTNVGIESLLNNAQLTDIRLSYLKNITDAILSNKNWSRVEHVNFQRCTGIQGFQQWDTATTGYYAMQSMSLADCAFLVDESILHICAKCPKIEKLSLSFCNALSPEIAPMLVAGCPFIKHLDLSYTNVVTDDSLLVIALGLIQLETISIRGCSSVTNEGIQSLYSNSKVKSVNSTQCQGIKRSTIC